MHHLHVRVTGVSADGRLTLTARDGRRRAVVRTVTVAGRRLPLRPSRPASRRTVTLTSRHIHLATFRLAVRLRRRAHHGILYLKLRFSCPPQPPQPQPEAFPPVTSGRPLGLSTAFGFNDEWSEYYHPGAVALSAAIGANADRQPMFWANIEPTRGQYNWDFYDATYQQMLANGVRPLLEISAAPCWAHPSDPCGANPRQVWAPDPAYDNDWKRLLTAIASRYPEAIGVEIWNEPNMNTPGLIHAVPPDRYVQLLKAASDGIRAVNPRMPVIAAALIPDVGPSPYWIDWRDYLNAEYQHAPGLMESASDAVAAHPYPRGDPAAAQVTSWLDQTRHIMVANGDVNKPIWVTEVGEAEQGPYAREGAGTQRQAEDLVSIYRTLQDRQQRLGDVPVVMFHRLFDIDAEVGFGIIARDGTPKPAYCAIDHAAGGHAAVCP
jgi:hypothetical protein